MKNFCLKTWHDIKLLFKDRAYVISFFSGVAMLIFGLFVNDLASVYKDVAVFPSVGDAILDQIPTYNLEILFTWGIAIIGLVVMIFPIFFMPEKIPFMMKSYGLLWLMRAVFITLTSIGPPEGFFYAAKDISQVSFGFVDGVMFKNDLFFSGHVSLPFMAFLLFMGHWFRWVMFGASILMGATVLLMHVHYSIDVFAAYFITYGIFALSNTIFNDLNERFSTLIKTKGWKQFKEKLKEMSQKRHFSHKNK